MGISDRHHNQNMQHHSASRLTYALDETGQLVDVNNVPAGNKCGCFCPACKGPLIAKNQGTARMHHFAHQSGTECEYAIETMLHLLAKEKIREAFLSTSEFWIEFEYKSFCPNNEECKFLRYTECSESKRKRYNIKHFYDSCEQEIPYDNINRRSDLKIFSSTNPERPPIYLEFCVTHASDLEKLHSGNKIIELCIKSEDDVLQLAESGINESNSQLVNVPHNCEKNLKSISFYGFKNNDYDNRHISTEIEFIRYILYQSGKSQCIQDSCNCKRLAKSKCQSLLEICIHTPDIFDLYETVKYIGFQTFKIPNCILCMNYVDSYYGMKKICRLHKQLQIPRSEYFDTSRAKTCHHFEIEQQTMQSVLKNGLNEHCTLFCNNRTSTIFSLKNTSLNLKLDSVKQ